MTGFYMECNTGLKWVNVKFKKVVSIKDKRIYVTCHDSVIKLDLCNLLLYAFSVIEHSRTLRKENWATYQYCSVEIIYFLVAVETFGWWVIKVMFCTNCSLRWLRL